MTTTSELVAAAKAKVGKRGVTAAIDAASEALRRDGFVAVGTGSCAPARAGVGVMVPRRCGGSASSATYYGVTCWLTLAECRDWAQKSTAVAEACVVAMGPAKVAPWGGRAATAAAAQMARDAARITAARRNANYSSISAALGRAWERAVTVGDVTPVEPHRLPDDCRLDIARHAYIVDGERVLMIGRYWGMPHATVLPDSLRLAAEALATQDDESMAVVADALEAA